VEYNDRAVIATNQRLCLLELNFFAKPTGLLAEIDRQTELGPWQGTLMYSLPAFDGNLTVHRRFRDDLTEADRLAGFEPEAPNALHGEESDRSRGGRRNAQAKGESVKGSVGSVRWKVAGVIALYVGCVATIGAVAAIMQIVGAASAQHFTPSQDAVGLSAFAVGLGGAVVSIIVLVRWWRRPGLAVRTDGVAVYQRRPVAVPWAMISEPPLLGPGSGDSKWGLRLVNGSVLRTTALRKVPDLSRLAGDGDPPAQVPWAYGPPGPRRRRARRCAELPGPALARSDTPFHLGEWRWLMTLPLFCGFLVLFPNGEGGAQSGIDIGGAIVVTLVFEALVAALLTAVWATLSRSVAVGETWVAWHPRGVRRWRVLDFADVVSGIDMAWPRRSGIRLSRADGGGLRLRAPELAAHTGAALRERLAAHPALEPGQFAVWTEHQTRLAVSPPRITDLGAGKGG
jgi:hypothetical protein